MVSIISYSIAEFPQKQILSLIRSADACVLSLVPDPSIELTLPAKFQAYLLSGHPILCVARGESKILVERFQLGAVAEPDSLESIVNGIQRICRYSSAEKKVVESNMAEVVREYFQEEKSKETILYQVTGTLRAEQARK